MLKCLSCNNEDLSSNSTTLLQIENKKKKIHETQRRHGVFKWPEAAEKLTCKWITVRKLGEDGR